MTKPNSPDVKLNNFNIRVSNHDLDVLHARAKSVGMQLTQYMRWRGMQPVGQIKKAQERKSIDREAIAAYLQIHNELNRQGINLKLTASRLVLKSFKVCYFPKRWKASLMLEKSRVGGI